MLVTVGAAAVLVIVLSEKCLFGRRVVEGWERGRLRGVRRG